MTDSIPKGLTTLAAVIRQWQDRNFDGMTELDGAAVVAEEGGEVLRAALKARFGIRPETRGALAEELPDVIMGALALADRAGLNIETCLSNRFERLLTLDFKKNVEAGQK